MRERREGLNMGAEAIGQFIAELRNTEEEKLRFSKIIAEFVHLYHSANIQTWCNTKWRGVHAFKCPTDMWIYQELIHEIRPDVIIETGSGCGGSALFMADMLRACGLPESIVVTIDVDHSKVFDKVKEDKNIFFVEGSSIDEKIFNQVKFFVNNYFGEGNKVKIMVMLDSDHSKEHVAAELELYAPLVSPGSMLIIEDTNIAGPNDAVEEWYKLHPEFELNLMCEKFMLTFNRGGYFERKEEGQ